MSVYVTYIGIPILHGDILRRRLARPGWALSFPLSPGALLLGQ